jgi:hypothetical protein
MINKVASRDASGTYGVVNANPPPHLVAGADSQDLPRNLFTRRGGSGRRGRHLPRAGRKVLKHPDPPACATGWIFFAAAPHPRPRIDTGGGTEA